MLHLLKRIFHSIFGGFRWDVDSEIEGFKSVVRTKQC